MKVSITLMVRKYRKESKLQTNGRENTGTKVNITLMIEKYRNESKYHTSISLPLV
jgi:hypothetical protein